MGIGVSATYTINVLKGLPKMVDGVENRPDNDELACQIWNHAKPAKEPRLNARTHAGQPTGCTSTADSDVFTSNWSKLGMGRMAIGWLSHLYVEGIRLHMAQTHEKNGYIQATQAFIAICRTQLTMDINVIKNYRQRTLGNNFRKYRIVKV